MIRHVEDALVGALKARFAIFGEKLRTIETIGANFNLDELKQRRNLAPAIYVAFLGGARKPGQLLTVNAEFAVFVLVAGAAGEDKRRRGSTAQAGAYAVLLAALPAIDQLKVPDVGTLTVEGIDNLFSEPLDEIGVSLYSARLAIPMPISADASLDEVDSFLRFHVDWMVPPHPVPDLPAPLAADVADAQDNVTLEGA